ncbi:hypothetical protein K458DRAFT_61501 [Lentithecium fluviatile CBS 122367]|uniref:Uncharacterized protein n=1 Tax=Lentithecium fluviatile CBS 122367 TaxID=1168545 RepID=A0A6G1JKB0_9PLEO|nr:hypothetical protein K458DRAFT_61501 [Lentithecium fluviatile CBS 122367]
MLQPCANAELGRKMEGGTGNGDSPLSSSIPNVSALESDRASSPASKKKQAAARTSSRALRATRRVQGVPTPETTGTTVTQKQATNTDTIFPNAHAAYIHQALKTLTYDTNPPELSTPRGSWITGLRKPLPHPALTPIQNAEILAQTYHAEIDRLTAARRKLDWKTAGGHGTWHYEHFGSTVKLRKRPLGVRAAGGWEKFETVFARGVWKYVGDRDGRVIMRELDEWPRDVWGEPVGWMVILEAGESEDEIDEEVDEDGDETEEEEGEDDGDEYKPGKSGRNGKNKKIRKSGKKGKSGKSGKDGHNRTSGKRKRC